MADHILARKTEVMILEFHMERALAALLRISDNRESVEKIPAIIDKVRYLLQAQGLSSVKQCNDLFIADGLFEVNIKENKALEHLIGIINPGSYITWFDDEGKYWQARYFYNSRTIVTGKIIFPNHPYNSFPDVID